MLEVERDLGTLLGSVRLLPIRGSWERALSSPAVLTVLGLAIAVTAIQLAWPAAQVTRRLGLHYGVDVRESWRLVTWLFPHEVGPGHLLANGLGIFVYGSLLSAAIGNGRFLALFVLTGIFGGAWSVAVAPTTLVGNSGASQTVFGIFGGLLGAGLAWALAAGDLAPARRMGLLVGALLVYIIPLSIVGQLYAGGGFRPAIGVWGIIGHSPGFLAGIALGFAYAHSFSPAAIALMCASSGLVLVGSATMLLTRRAPWPLFFPG